MATYLSEHEVGFDTQKIGFPGLASCMGIVLHTSNGLFGYHCPPGTEDRVRGYSNFCRSHTHYGVVNELYGCCRFGMRWHSESDRELAWQREMKFFATALNFKGSVWGFDMSSPSTGINDTIAHNAYLEFKLGVADNVPRIKTALMSDLTETRASVLSPTTGVRTVRPPSKTGYELRVPYSVTPGHSRITTNMVKNPGTQKRTATGSEGFSHFVQH